MIGSIADLVGNTPLLKIERISREAPGVEIYAKLEYFNPGGSVKDRAALQMVRDALADGRFEKGKTLIDSTSGNTGIALAWIGAALGFKVALVMPSNVSLARKQITAAYGAELIFSDPLEGSDGAIRQVRRVIDEEDGASPFGLNIVASRGRTVMIADTSVTERPTAEQLAAIAIRSAAFARRVGQEPRVAFISYTTFGNPPGRHIEELRDAVRLLDSLVTDFEYEGEMGPDVALNHDMQVKFYPFTRLTGPANILIMPGLQSANISAKLLRALGGESVLGPFLMGMALPVQIAPMTATANDLVTLAVLAAGGADAIRKPPPRSV